MNMMEGRANEYLVDDKGEGGLVCELDRSPLVDQPTIIIGVGGTGMDAMLHAKYIIQRKIKAPEGMKKPGRIAFLSVDTDARDFEKKRVGDVRVDDGERVNVYETHLASFMKNPSLITQEWLRDWLCEGINADDIKYGAGGIRQCGRFMLINKAQTFIDKIKNVAAEVWAAGDENGAPFPPDTSYNVYLLTGVSGGTGSGMFLDAAYLIRKIFEIEVHRKLSLRGIIFLPDVNLCKVKDADTRAYIPVNGYAALRELDYWMNSSRGRNFTQQYTPMLTVDTPEAPFDLCFLMSPNGAMPADYVTCMQTTGETLMNILTAPDESSGFSFDSFLTNLPSMKAAAALHFSYSGNYIYASMGMDEQRLQLDSMANYLAYYLLLRVNGLFEREPVKEEVEGLFTKTLKLDSKKGLQRQFDKTIPARPFNEVVRSLDDFKKAIANYRRASVLDDGVLDSELSTWVTQCEVTYGKAKNGLVEECMTVLRTEIEKCFINLEFGPYYAHRMMHNVNVGKPDILKRLEEERNAVSSFLSTASDREDKLKSLANNALNSARRNRHVPLVASPRYNDYVEAIFRLYDHIRYTKFATVAYDFYTRMLDEGVNYNNLIVERFSNLLTHLTQVFKSNSDIITNVDKDGTTHTWNVGNFSKIRAMVDQAMASLKGSGKEDALVKEFLECMLRDRNAWVGDEGSLGESFSRFVSEKFGTLMQQTMEDTYKDMYSLTSDAQLCKHIETKVMPKLQGGAKVLYTSDDVLSSMSVLPQSAVICVPNMATNILQAANEYVKDHNLRCTVVPSRRQGSLFWFQTIFALPLFANNALKTYQIAHDVHGAVDKHLGRYLKMSAKENWLELLPPLMPETTWEYAKYKNEKWSKRNAETRMIFRESWDAGLVQPLSAGSSVYVLGKVDQGAYDKLLARSLMSQEDMKRVLKDGATAAASLKVSPREAKAYCEELKAFDKEGWTPSKPDIFKNEVFSKLMHGEIVADEHADPVLRVRQILEENLLWTPDLAAKLAEQLKKKRALHEVIQAYETYLELGNTESNERELFADALMYGLYRPTVPKVFQLDVTDAGVPTFMLMSITDYKLAPAKDPFYALFRKFVTLEPKQKQIMKKISEQRQRMMNMEMNNGDTRRYSAYAKMVKGIDATMKRRLDEIDMDIAFNHPEIREFYVEMRRQFELFLPDDGMGGMM